MPEKTIGYARTASNEQDINSQVEMLKAAGCTEVYTDEATGGANLNRSGLNQALAALQPGDTLKVARVDRISRSGSGLNTFLTALSRKHVELVSLDEPDAAMMVRLRDALNYGPAIPAETPFLRKLAYRLGAFFIRISGRGQIPAL